MGQERGTTFYQEGRIASFCESREDLGPGMEPALTVPQDPLVPGRVSGPPGGHRRLPAPLHRRWARLPRHLRRAPRRLPRPILSGRTDREALLANALPVILIAVLVGGALSSQVLLSQADAIPLASAPGSFASETMALSNGTVVPYHADPPQ